jgi:hypothetical protein
MKQFMNAKEMIMKRSIIANNFTIAAVTALALGLAPTAKADDKGCSKLTLKGTFAHAGAGFITAPPATAGPFAHVSAQTFDGDGGTTATGIVSVNGNIIPVTEKGTYTVNSDCTGTWTVQLSPVGITGHVFFVIYDTGNALQVIGTDANLVVTGVLQRQFPRGDPRQ